MRKFWPEKIHLWSSVLKKKKQTNKLKKNVRSQVIMTQNCLIFCCCQLFYFILLRFLCFHNDVHRFQRGLVDTWKNHLKRIKKWNHWFSMRHSALKKGAEQTLRHSYPTYSNFIIPANCNQYFKPQLRRVNPFAVTREFHMYILKK